MTFNREEYIKALGKAFALITRRKKKALLRSKRNQQNMGRKRK